MKKAQKIACFCYCLLFLCLCALPGAGLLIDKEDSTAENRTLAAFPALTDEEGRFNQAWGAQFQSYVSDHFGFRSQMVMADSSLKANLLHTSAEEDVIIGSDGWLYYTPTVNDFIENPTVSDIGIQNISRNLELMQAYAESKGSQLLVTVIPNKNTVYPKYMPSFYRKSGVDNNLTRLTQALKTAEIPHCDMASALCQAAQDTDIQLYHKQDSHWNASGALLGYHALLDAGGIAHEDYAECTWHEEAIWEGDLQRMLFPDSDELDIQHVYDIAFSYTYLGRYKDADDMNIDTMNPAGTGTLLMFRDSFGEAIIPYLSERFASAKYSRARPYPMHHLDNQPYDLVIAEIVERNISWLQREAPLHHALTAEHVPAALDTCEGTLQVINDGTRYLHLFGTMDCLDDAAHAPHYYVTLTDPAGQSSSYLAYSCYEAELLGDDEVKDNGFSLWLDSTAISTEGDYTVTVTADVGNTVLKFEAFQISLAAG